MQATSETDLTDHVQLCLFCKYGIAFVPSVIQWWATVVPKILRERDAVTQRVYCPEGPEGKHRPDIDAAAVAARRRLAIEASGLADPLPYLA